MNLFLRNVARKFVKGEDVGKEFLDTVETAFRAFETLSSRTAFFRLGKMPLIVNIRNSDGEIIREIRRG